MSLLDRIGQAKADLDENIELRMEVVRLETRLAEAQFETESILQIAARDRKQLNAEINGLEARLARVTEALIGSTRVVMLTGDKPLFEQPEDDRRNELLGQRNQMLTQLAASETRVKALERANVAALSSAAAKDNRIADLEARLARVTEALVQARDWAARIAGDERVCGWVHANDYGLYCLLADCDVDFDAAERPEPPEDGRVLVPREPTEAMLDAAMAGSVFTDDAPECNALLRRHCAELYRAMLAAREGKP